MPNMISSFLHPERGYQAAQDAMQQYYGQGQAMMQPYMQQGLQAGGALGGAMGALLDPEALQAKWAQGYQTSPAAQQAQAAAQEQGLSAASSMGLMGSSPALQAIQAGTSQIGAQDRQQYLNDLMQKYMAGTGIGQSMFGQGAQMAGQGAQMAGQMGQNIGQMQFGQQNAPGSMFGNLLGAGVGLASSALGGPIGGAVANWMTGGK